MKRLRIQFLAATVMLGCRILNGAMGAMRAARIWSGVQRGWRVGLGQGAIAVFPPMGLNEHAVDLFEVYEAGPGLHGPCAGFADSHQGGALAEG